jgi:hypothetical protein
MFPEIDSSGNTERGGTCTILSVSVQGKDLAFGTDSQGHALGSFRTVGGIYFL